MTCTICHRTRDEQHLRQSVTGWRCKNRSTCKRRRLDARNRAAKAARLEALAPADTNEIARTR